MSTDFYLESSGTVEYASGVVEKCESVQQADFFLRYIDDIARTVKCDTENLLREGKKLYHI